MSLTARFAAVALALSVSIVQSAPARTEVKGSPNILGREIPRFVLLQPIRINRAAPGLTNRDLMDRLMGQILPGQLVPVSEDARAFTIRLRAASSVKDIPAASRAVFS